MGTEIYAITPEQWSMASQVKGEWERCSRDYEATSGVSLDSTIS